MRTPIALGMLAVTLAAPLAAGESSLTVDPAASRIAFTLQATMHEVHGTFAVVSGAVRFDPAAGAASGSVTVEATSGETGNAKRDRKMHDFVLRSAEHPRIVFEPASIEGTWDPSGTSRLQVRGTLRLLGVEHPVELTVDVSPEEGGALRARGTLAVPYVAWGREDPSAFLLRVGKTVDVEIDLRGRLSHGEAPPGGPPPSPGTGGG